MSLLKVTWSGPPDTWPAGDMGNTAGLKACTTAICSHALKPDATRARHTIAARFLLTGHRDIRSLLLVERQTLTNLCGEFEGACASGQIHGRAGRGNGAIEAARRRIRRGERVEHGRVLVVGQRRGLLH